MILMNITWNKNRNYGLTKKHTNNW